MSRPLYFLNLELPHEARACLRTLPTLETLEPLLESVLAHVLGLPDADAPKRLQREMSLDSASLAATFTGVHWMVRACMRSSLKPKALASELADVKVPPPFIEPILRTVERGCARSPAPIARALPTPRLALFPAARPRVSPRNGRPRTGGRRTSRARWPTAERSCRRWRTCAGGST